MDREFEWGYREPVVGDVGQEVEVGLAWQRRLVAAVLPEGMVDRFVCRARENPAQSHHWSRARIRVRLPYGERQAKCGIGVGDWVKVLRVPEHWEDGWDNEAVSSMDASVGKVFEVVEVHDKSGLFLKDNHWYPYFVLEKAEEPVVEPKSLVRRVSDLADGELVCTSEGRWFQMDPQGEYGNDPSNRPQVDCGWARWGRCHKGCRRARLLAAPEPELSLIGKTVIAVAMSGKQYQVDWVFAGAGEWRAVISCGVEYRVECLKDLLVVPEIDPKAAG